MALLVDPRCKQVTDASWKSQLHTAPRIGRSGQNSALQNVRRQSFRKKLRKLKFYNARHLYKVSVPPPRNSVPHEVFRVAAGVSSPSPLGPIATPRQSLSSICGTLCLAALLTAQEEAAEEPNRPLLHGTSDLSPTPQGRGPLRTVGCPGR